MVRPYFDLQAALDASLSAMVNLIMFERLTSLSVARAGTQVKDGCAGVDGLTSHPFTSTGNAQTFRSMLTRRFATRSI